MQEALVTSDLTSNITSNITSNLASDLASDRAAGRAWVALDVGASPGGWSQCLMQNVRAPPPLPPIFSLESFYYAW